MTSQDRRGGQGIYPPVEGIEANLPGADLPDPPTPSGCVWAGVGVLRGPLRIEDVPPLERATAAVMS